MTLFSIRNFVLTKNTHTFAFESSFRSVKKSDISYDNVKNYIDSPFKYYFMDLGLRNARLNFRQSERTHLMENLIYNELRTRGFNIDVGVVPVARRDAEGRQQRSALEVDFVCNLGSRRYYIQSAFKMENDEKRQQECASLLRIDDSFKKIIVVGDECPVMRDDKGIVTMSIYDFLLKDNSLEL